MLNVTLIEFFPRCESKMELHWTYKKNYIGNPKCGIQLFKNFSFSFYSYQIKNHQTQYTHQVNEIHHSKSTANNSLALIYFDEICCQKYALR